MGPAGAGVTNRYNVSTLFFHQRTVFMTTLLTRRRTLLAAGLSTLGLTACGFRLRGTFEAPFETMYLQMRVNSPVYNRLKRALTAFFCTWMW